MRSPLAFLLLAAVLTVPSTDYAQSVVAKTITFSGTPQSQSELLALSGLTPGKTLTKDDIEAAMNRLDKSGLFSDIQYSVSSGNLTFTLQPAEKAQMLKVQYQNFVWYTQDQLNEAVHSRLPLFTGSVPATGELRAQVADILKALLKQRGIDATISIQDLAGLKVEYAIQSPQVIVSDVRIDNIRFDTDPVLTSVRKALVNADYLEDITARAVQGNLSYALKEIGYLDETVGPVSHAQPTVEPTRINVVMTGTADPGSRYKVARVNLPPVTGTVAPADLQSEYQVKTGGPPSPSLVDNTVARLAHVFASHGFLDAAATVDSAKDSAAHTMSYTFNVVPGEVYHMRNLVFGANVNPAQQTQLTQAWKLGKGAVYESNTVVRSLMEPSAKTVCLGHPATEELVPDKATHEVDIRLTCGARR